MQSDSRIEASSQTISKQVCGPSKVDKKKKVWSGYVLEIARSPFGIFSSNDKQPSPSEELYIVKKCKKVKVKAFF